MKQRLTSLLLHSFPTVLFIFGDEVLSLMALTIFGFMGLYKLIEACDRHGYNG